jgi:hypothetical protein
MNEDNENLVDERYLQLREEVRRRIADLDAGNGIEINSDEELDAFFKEIEDEVRREIDEGMLSRESK